MPVLELHVFLSIFLDHIVIVLECYSIVTNLSSILLSRMQEEGVNITANAIEPGLIMTNLYKHTSLSMSMSRDPQQKHNLCPKELNFGKVR